MNDTTSKKLLKALKLFIPSSASLALKEDDAQRFFEIVEMNGLTIIHGESEPKVKYESINLIAKSVLQLCKKYIFDYEAKYYQIIEIDFDTNLEPCLKIRLYSRDHTRKSGDYLFNYTGAVSLKVVTLLLEEKLKGIETIAVIESPMEDTNPKTEE